MHTILILLRKDLSLLLRDKAALSLTFLVPFALIYLFGEVFGITRGDTGPTGIPLALVNESDNPAADRLLEALRAEKAFRVITDFTNDDGSTRPLAEADLRPLMRDNKFRFALVIPADLIREDRLGLHLKVLSNPRNTIETEMVNGILQKTIFSNVPQLLGQSLQSRAKSFLGGPALQEFNRDLSTTVAQRFGGDPAAIEKTIASGELPADWLGGGAGAAGDAAGAGGGTDVFASLVEIETEQVVGKNVKAPAATRIVGGWAMQFLLFAVSASAVGLFHEKEHGLFQRLLSSPATRAQILWSKFLYGVALGLVQLVVLFFAGRLLFGIQVEKHLGYLILVCVFAAAACTAFGMLIAAVSPSPEAARGIATFLILLMSAIGGAWFPVSFMPEFIQTLSRFTLVFWAMQGFEQVLWADASFMELLPTLGCLAGITALIMALALWRFDRGRIFD